MTALTLKYRPRVFDDVIGQERTTAVIRALVLKPEKMPPCLIFGGTRGSGKTTTARIMAAALNCPNLSEFGDPCGECSLCQDVWVSSNTSVIEVDAASHNGVEEIHKIKDIAQYKHAGKYRVFLLDEVHSLSNAAFNALLKTLEEPPPHTVFILLTTETHKILETIRSRAMNFEFQRIQPADIVKRLTQVAEAEAIPCTEEMLNEIARLAKGGMRDAVMMLDQAHLTGCTDGSSFAEQFGLKEYAPPLVGAALSGNLAEVTKLAAEAVGRSGDAGQLIAEITEVIRDLVVVKTGGIPPCMEHQLEVRLHLASKVNGGNLYSALKVLWAAKDRARVDEDQLTCAQVTCILLADALKTAPLAEPIQEASSVSEAMTAAEMAEMVQKAALG